MRSLIICIAACITLSSFAQEKQTDSFNLQVGFKDDQGNVMPNQNVDVKVSILKDSPEGESIFTETQSVTTNLQGLANIVVGTSGKSDLSQINWNQPLFLKLESMLEGDDAFTIIDISPILSVPYALHTNTTFSHEGNLGETLWHNGEGWVATSRLAFNNSTVEVTPQTPRIEEEPIFLVRNSQNQIVFAVYESGATVYVPYGESPKGTRGGFAVGGLSDQTKESGNFFMQILPDDVQFNILPPTDKGQRGGFAVGGLSDQTKGLAPTHNFLSLSPDSVRFNLEYDLTKGQLGGFAVGGLSDQTKSFTNWLNLNHDTTYLQTALDVSQGASLAQDVEVGGEVVTMPVSDIDGNEYPTIQIGNQVWMTRNLKVTHYRTGEPIDETLEIDYQAGYSIYSSDLVDGLDTPEAVADAYGNLYNWHALNNSQGLCPAGWVIPSNEDWEQLITHLGGESVAGKLLKSIRTEGTHEHPRWNIPNEGANNFSGFRGLPGGYYFAEATDNKFFNLGNMGYWWSSNQVESDQDSAYIHSLSSDLANIQNMAFHMNDGFSVRCLKADAMPPTVTTDPVTELTSSSATLNGEVTDNGGADLSQKGFIWGTGNNPTLENNTGLYIEEETDNQLSHTLADLNPDQTYYFRIFATNMAGTAYGNVISFTTIEPNNCGEVIDIDGNTYNTVTIGDQCWMRENLKTTKLRDGTSITDWYSAQLETPAYMAHTDDEIYGAMYNGYAVLTEKLCPAGWYIPSEDDFLELVNYLGGTNVAGEKLKATGLEYWNDPNIATNESGFTGLPAGAIWGEGITDVGSMTNFWSSTEGEMGKNNKSEGHVMLNLQNYSEWADIYPGAMLEEGYSVRCLNGYGLPRLTNPVIASIDINQFTVSAQIIDDGGDPENPITERGIVLSTSPEPTTNDMVIPTEGDIGEFTLDATSLDPNTLYYVRAFATNGNGTKYSKEVMAKTYNQQITDIDNNTYLTTQIAGQHWMAQNLKTTQFNDGTAISYFNGLDTPSEFPYHTENPNQGTDAIDFGYLYSHGVVYMQDKNVCPDGWRVPVKEDWDQLIAELGGPGIAGGQMKSTVSGGNGLWESPNEGASNKSGFTAMPAGIFKINWQGTFSFTDESIAAYFWSQTEASTDISWSLKLNYYDTNATIESVYGTIPEGEEALSIRCIEDNTFPVITDPAQSITNVSAVLNARFEPIGEQTVDQVGFVWSAEPNPTDEDNVIISNDYENSFASDLTGIDPNTRYYIRAFVTTTDDQVIYGNAIDFKTYYDKISDTQGNEYYTTMIGDQQWMAQNLAATKFQNGDDIYYEPHGSVPPEGIYYSENPTPGENAENFGYVYSISAATNHNGICPIGWSLPEQEDWEALIDYLGGPAVAGGKMKTTTSGGYGYWESPNAGATNESSFSAVPAGYRGSSGYYYGGNTEAWFWSGTEVSDERYSAYSMTHDNAGISKYELTHNYGTEDALSIRCLKHYGEPTVSTLPVKNTSTTSTEAVGNVLFENQDDITEVGFVWGINPEPTLTNNDGAISATLIDQSFSTQITELTTNTRYYIRAYATTANGEVYGNEINFKTYYGSTTDIENNAYFTIEINNDIWMAENLRTTKFADGSDIMLSSSGSDWYNLTEPAYIIYSPNGGANDEPYVTEGLETTQEVAENYGALYNWYAVETGNLCPDGWRVPTNAEWGSLIDYLGGPEVAGIKLKGTSTAPDQHPRWLAPNQYANNESGFNAIPSGNISSDFYGIGQIANWWTATSGAQDMAYSWSLELLESQTIESESNVTGGFSVRCIKE
ncbi:MAG: FISUMP domain-containing protein [Bacteroidales bacterium]